MSDCLQSLRSEKLNWNANDKNVVTSQTIVAMAHVPSTASKIAAVVETTAHQTTAHQTTELVTTELVTTVEHAEANQTAHRKPPVPILQTRRKLAARREAILAAEAIHDQILAAIRDLTTVLVPVVGLGVVTDEATIAVTNAAANEVGVVTTATMAQRRTAHAYHAAIRPQYR